MIKSLKCVNISFKNLKALADFYKTIGAPVFVEDNCYDGWFIGNPEQGGTVCVWDESRWGKSAAGFVTIVLNADDLQKAYEEIRAKGIALDLAKPADWGRQEFVFHDLDGNIIMLL